MKVTLNWRECERDRLPDICASCGAAADSRVWRKFNWNPGWIWVFIFVGGIPGIVIAMLITRKSMRVRVPLCRDHVNQWRNRDLFASLTILGTIAIFIAGVVMLDGGPGRRDNPLAGIMMSIGGIGFVICLIAIAIWSNCIVRPSEITHDDITLAGVHQDFVDAVDGRPRSREYDDYDDEAPRKNRYDEDEPRRRRERDEDRNEDDDDDFRPPRR